MTVHRVAGLILAASFWLRRRPLKMLPPHFPLVPRPAGDPRDLVRRAAENDELNDKRARDYTYTEHQTEQKLDRHDRVTSTHTETHEIMVLDGEIMERLVARDDKPLSEHDAQKEDRPHQQVARETQERKSGRQKETVSKEKKKTANKLANSNVKLQTPTFSKFFQTKLSTIEMPTSWTPSRGPISNPRHAKLEFFPNLNSAPG